MNASLGVMTMIRRSRVVLWRALPGDPQQRRELFVLGPIALLTFYAVNPPLWHDPFFGVVEHVRLNLGRPDVNPLGAGLSRLPGWWAGQQRPPINFLDYAFAR